MAARAGAASSAQKHYLRFVIKAEAELIVRELVARYGTEPFRMSESEMERLAEAIRTIGQTRVFEIAAEQWTSAGCGKTRSRR